MRNRTVHQTSFQCARRAGSLLILLLAVLPLSAKAADDPCCDVKSWQEQNVTGPSARTNAEMAYDSARHRLVLFGGSDLSSVKGDTWEWDGTKWTLKSPSGPAPSPRSRHAMAYDAARGRIVLFGGADASGVRGDTWEWDGTTWTAKANTGPVARFDHAMAYDSGRGKVILFGGSGLTSILNDTWEWDGTTWKLKATGGPAPRYAHAMAGDALHGRVVLFGGIAIGTPTPFSDTWEWDGSTWTLRSVPGPTRRYGHSMAFDAACGRIVLFGGISSSAGGRLGDTWQWNGANWTQLTASGPSPRTGSATDYDSANDRIVTFGGYDGNPNYTKDTWLLRTAPSAPLTITQQPANLTLSIGQTATFSAAVSGSGPFTYQWRKDGANLTDGGPVSGARTNMLVLAPTVAANAGAYDVMIRKSCQTITSATAVLTFSPPKCLSPPAGMIAWYPFDEPSGALAHETRNGTNGLLIGTASFGAGKVDHALSLDGAGGYVRASNPPLNAKGSLTVDAWIFPANPAPLTEQSIVNKMDGTRKGFDFFLYQGALGLGFSDAPVIQGGVFSAPNAVPQNQWSHVAVTIDSSLSTHTFAYTFYVNGIVVGQGTRPWAGQGDLSNNADLLIGITPGFSFPAWFFKGAIDELGIFNRSLSGAEILALFQASSVGRCKLACNTLYAIDFNANTPAFTSTLYTLDAVTGAVKSTVGISGIGPTLGIAFGPDNFLYAVTTAGGSTPNSLYKINPANGVAQLVGSLQIPGGVVEGDLAFSANGTLYGISGSDLFTVNRATGRGTLVGTVPGGVRDISYLAFNNLTGSLYALDNGPGTSLPSTLLRLNPTNAQISSSMQVPKLGGWGGMDFEPKTGMFYLADSGPGGTNKLYTFDAATATLKPIGPTNLTPGLSGIAFCRQATGCVPPPTGLVAWYSLDDLSGTAAKDLAAGNSGAYVNAPGSIVGEVALGRLFNGRNTYVEALDKPWLNPGDFSIDAWVNLDSSADTTGVRVIVEKRGTPLRGYSFYLYNRRPGLQLADSSGYSNYIATSEVPADGKWHLVAVTVVRNQATGGTLYIDGLPVGTFNPTNRRGPLTNASPLRLGSLTLGVGSVFRGGLDEVEIFNRALTPLEVGDLFKVGTSGKCK